MKFNCPTFPQAPCIALYVVSRLWDGSNGLHLLVFTSRIWQKLLNVTSKIMLQNDCSFCLGYCLLLSFGSLIWKKPVDMSYVSLTRRSSHGKPCHWPHKLNLSLDEPIGPADVVIWLNEISWTKGIQLNCK